MLCLLRLNAGRLELQLLLRLLCLLNAVVLRFSYMRVHLNVCSSAAVPANRSTPLLGRRPLPCWPAHTHPHGLLLRPALPQKLTFLRMGDMMIDNWSAFGAFLQRLTCPPS